MRLLRIVIGSGEVLRLHPQVTVVSAVDGTARHVLLDTVTRLATGIDTDTDADSARGLPQGLVEAHGVLLDLDTHLLTLLDAGATPVDPVVRAGQLPSRPATRADRPSDEGRRLDEELQMLGWLLEEAVAHRDDIDAAAAQVTAARYEALDTAARRALAEAEIGGSAVHVARIRLDDARQALLEAEEAARDRALDPALVARLEEVHADLLDARDRADRPIGGGRARRQVAVLQADEQAVLDELGFASYSTYMMRSSLAPRDPAVVARLVAARVDLAEAERDWRALADEAEQALASTEVTVALEAALDDAGLCVAGESFDADELVAVAGSWLDVAAEHRARAVATAESLTERRALLEADLTALGPSPAGRPGPSLAEEVGWYLLARLASQRAASLGGSVPLLLDDALQGLEEREVLHVLDRLERMAAVVQVIILSDDPVVSAWAQRVGADRAAVVSSR